MANYFLGIKGTGVRGLNWQINNKKLRGKTLQNTIDNIQQELKRCDVIEFDGNNDVYVGTFFYSKTEKTIPMLKQSKEYKKCFDIVTEDFKNIGVDSNNFIIELSTDMI